MQMPPLRRSNALRLCDRRTDATDRPGRCHQSITCLPTSRELDPPRKGWVFCSLEAQGQGSLCPSAPSLPNRWGRLTSPAGSLGGLSREGKEGTAEHEQAKRASSFRAAGSRTTEKTQGFARTQRRESEAKKPRSWHPGKLARNPLRWQLPQPPIFTVLSVSQSVFLPVFFPVS